MSDLRQRLIKLAHEVPETRQYIVPLLRTAGSVSPTQEGAKAIFDRYKAEHPGTRKSPRDFYQPSDKKESPKKPEKHSLITPAEKNLPKEATQSAKTKDALFKEAREAHELQLNWLDRGSGLDKKLGTKAIRLDQGQKPDYTMPGPIVIIGPMKNEDRASEKVKAEKDGDWSRLTDIVRATIAVDTFDDIHALMGTLRESGMKMASQPHDRFSNPSDVGYRDMLLRVRYPNGHVGELQLHVKAIVKAKEEGHKLYSEVRSIESKAKSEGRTTLTEAEDQAVVKANDAQRKLYQEAWDRAEGIPRKKTSADHRDTSYYVYDGTPAKWEFKKFPVLLVKGKPVTVYFLAKFFREAKSISEDDFKKLISK